ncbi:carbohydrate-binding protein [Paenibacillus alginolyticus]|uniref:Carbohydrate-binding protein n=1 Tax=Paenibacillus alginolyticus TaxID=59839 RepID=A0ABT4G929_9BACL|nr:carbohydrate-binding protein [Paenibacillus alginolyticus]MCY9692687.1 carbohydrate-binding protein [Paenibacillus alginolyticus]
MKLNFHYLTRKPTLICFLVFLLVFTQISFFPSVSSAATNLALNKAVTTSGHNDVYVETNVNDGNQATYWESTNNAFPQWIRVDLGSANTINQVVLKLPAGWGTRSQTLSVMGSTDDVNYSTLVAFAAYTFDPVNSNIVTINFTGSSARYVKINVTANTGWAAAQVSELEIYGTAAPTPTPTPTPTPSGAVIPGKIEAESYSAMFGIQTETTTDTGGGLNVGWTDTGDWMDYSVNVQSAGTYTVGFRVASNSSTSQLQLKNSAGTVLTTVDVPNTGGWQTWTTVNANVNLTAGNQTLRFYVSSTGLNLNWMNFTSGSTPTPIPTPTPTPTPPATTSNLALGKSISASSSVLSFIATNANDGNVTTYWEGAGGSYPNTLSVDLGANASISSIILKLNPDTAWGARTQNIQVLGHDQYSTTFNNLVSAANYSFSPSTGSNTVTIPLSATASAVQLKITSNTGASAGQVAEFEIMGVPAPNPDLTVTGLTWTPSAPIETNTITLNATVQNIGAAPSAATDVRFYLGSTLVGTSSVGALSAGASTTVSANIGAQNAGTYTVTAKADEANAVIEQNENNNNYTSSSSLTVTQVASSDLVGTVSWTPSTPVAGNADTFNVDLKNQGTIASASGSHGITVVLKNSVGSTVQTFSGSYSGSLAAGASTNVSIAGTWTAAEGNYTVTTTVAVDANEVATKQANNVNTANLVVYAQRGASMPYSRYDTDDAVRGGGATLQSAPTFDQALIASEASGQRYVALPSNGSNLQWTVRQGQGGAGVTMRFTMPDSSDGMGLNGSLDVYVNGANVKTVPLTSYYSWQYFSGDMPADAPGGGRPLFRFDEVHWKLDTPLQPGDTIRIQKNNGDSLEYGVDFIEIEPVPAAIARPANSVSVTDFGAVPNDGQDDLAAFNAAVNAAVASGKIMYIPEGTFHLGDMWKIGSVSNMINNITIVGAGIWHTNIQFTNPNSRSGGISFRVQGQIDFSNIYLNSKLRSRYGQEAVYKAFMDDFGTNSKFHDVWLEHFECGFWVADYAHQPAIIATGLIIENSRIRNNLADGVNFCQGTSNSIVRNSSLRNNGDDALAVWTDNTNGAPAGVNNTFSYNTIENNWRAGAIAFFGGSGHKADHNFIIDTVGGSGFRMNTVFPGYHFQNNTGIVFSDNTIINSGTSRDLYNGERGAIDLEASNDAIKNVTLSNIDIINTQRDAVQFGYGGGFENIVFNNITINGTGLDGITTSRFSGPHKGSAIYTYTGNGSATFNNLMLSNIANPNTNYIQSGFNLIIH